MIARSIKRLALAIATVGVLASIGASPAMATFPVTEPATDVSPTQATLHAKINNEGTFSKHFNYVFRYGTTQQFGSTTELVEVYDAEEKVYDVTARVEGLQPSTTYYFQIGMVAEHGGFALGKTLSFKTAPPGLYLTDKETGKPAIASTGYPTGLLAEARDWTLWEKGGWYVECDVMGFEGNTISEPESELTSRFLSLAWEGCDFTGEPARLKTNFCKYVYEVTGAGAVYTGNVTEIVCPPGKAIELSMEEVDFCTITIPPQKVEGPVTYDDTVYEGLSVIDTDVTGAGISFEKSGPLCFLLSGGTTDATFGGELMLFKH